MANTVIPQASLFLGIIPALILLYISLKGFEGHYKDKNIFLSFVVGIIGGFIAAIIEILTRDVLIFFIILFPIVEQLLKTMALNIRRLQEKSATVIYGLSLGLGFGAIFTPVSLFIVEYQLLEPLVLALILIGSIGIILFHGATGILLGYGIYLGKLTQYLILTIVLHIPLTSIIFITLYLKVEYLQMSLVLYGLFLYWYATKKIMPQILEISKRRKRKIRVF